MLYEQRPAKLKHMRNKILFYVFWQTVCSSFDTIAIAAIVSSQKEFSYYDIDYLKCQRLCAVDAEVTAAIRRDDERLRASLTEEKCVLKNLWHNFPSN